MMGLGKVLHSQPASACVRTPTSALACRPYVSLIWVPSRRAAAKVTDDRGDVGIGDVYRHAGIRHQPIVAQSPVRDTPLAVLLDEAILVLARAEDLVAGGSGQSDHAGAAPGGDVPVDLVEDPWSSGGPARRGHAHLRIRVMRAAPGSPSRRTRRHRPR